MRSSELGTRTLPCSANPMAVDTSCDTKTANGGAPAVAMMISVMVLVKIDSSG